MAPTGGRRGDGPQFVPVLERISVPRCGPGRPRTRPERVPADKAYPAAYPRRRQITATIPVKAGQAAHRRAKDPAGGFAPGAYRLRHAVECGVDLLEQHRAVATGYDRLAARYQATIHIAVIDIWLRTLTKTTF